jgi:transcriptional regulator with XRE-family HTH domain
MTNKISRKSLTGLEAFEAGSPRRRRLLRQEQLIVQVAEQLVELLERENVSRSELGRRLGKTKGFVSQILAGDKNLTLRTVADVCDALGFRAHLETARDSVAQQGSIERLMLTTTFRIPRVTVFDAQPPCPPTENPVAA